jgi:hypothetical protein
MRGCLAGSLRRPRRFSALQLTLLSAACLVLLSGCALLHGGDPSRLDYSDFRSIHLPMVRQIHHPDTVRIDDDVSFKDLRLQWSSAHNQRFGARRYAPSGFRTFATLWSRELAQVGGSYQVVIDDLSPDLQERMRARTTEAYASTLMFEVHMFVPSDMIRDVSETNLRGSGSQVRLELGTGETLSASAIEPSAVEVYEVPGPSRNVVYRLNRVYFDRKDGERDRLEGVESARLVVVTVNGSNSELWFEWRFAE